MGSYYQDSAQALPGASILDFLSRTVLIATTHPSFYRTPCTSIRIHYRLDIYRAEGVWLLVSGPCETGSRARAPMDGFTACPEASNRITLAPMRITSQRQDLIGVV